MKIQLPAQADDFELQDWTTLEPGQRVWVRFSNGGAFRAIVETKTNASDAVWVIHDDLIRTRQVFCHTEGIQLLPFEQPSDERVSDACTLDWPSIRQPLERHFMEE